MQPADRAWRSSESSGNDCIGEGPALRLALCTTPDSIGRPEQRRNVRTLNVKPLFLGEARLPRLQRRSPKKDTRAAAAIEVSLLTNRIRGGPQPHYDVLTQDLRTGIRRLYSFVDVMEPWILNLQPPSCKTNLLAGT